MAQEIEAKFHLPDVRPMREVIRAAGAAPLGTVLETNRYFDWPDGTLRRGDRGLRIREARPLPRAEGSPPADASPIVTITYKGPRQASELKVREEIELHADDPAAAAELLSALGLANTLTFQKRRESWRLDNCRVELDELPRLGHFLEIEGPDEASVSAVRRKLGLAETPVEQTPYLGLLAAYLHAHGITAAEITF